MRFSAGVLYFLAFSFTLCLLPPGKAEARPEFAQFTGNPCIACHISPQGGGELNNEGKRFRSDLKNLAIPLDPGLRVTTGQRLGHLVLYFLHIPFGVSWVGLFLYLFGPALRRGIPAALPRAYVRQILYGMVAVLLTGPPMVLFRMKMTPGLFSTRFGLLLIVKTVAAAVLLASTTALLWHLTVSLGRRYRRYANSLDAGAELELTARDLLLFSGREEGKALVAVDGMVYDVSGRNLWRKGIHPGGHHAGHDLTDAFSGAPHGREVLQRVAPVGRLTETEGKKGEKPLSWAVQMGVAASLAILAVVAMWRW